MLTHDNKILGFNDGHRWLSNFEPCNILFEGLIYPSTEHAYQAAKTFSPAERIHIQGLELAVEAKRAGKKVMMREDWTDQRKLEVMFYLNWQKYNKYNFRKLLLETGDAYIEETNYWGDKFWGVCYGKGKNHLGHIIMNIREELRNGIGK
jgi:ribA/ribD-fused uncharacterized protein